MAFQYHLKILSYFHHLILTKMSDLTAYTNCLDLLAAKKLLSSFQKPEKNGSWTDWSGEGGSEIEVKKKELPASLLMSFEVPNFCSSYYMSNSEELIQHTNIPKEPLIGGDAFVLPEYGDRVTARFTVVIRELNYPVSLEISKMRGVRYESKSYNDCCSIELFFPKMEYQMRGLSYGVFPDKNTARFVIDNFKSKFSLPDKSSPGFLEERTLVESEIGEFSLTFDYSYYGMLKKSFMSMLGQALADTPCNVYQFMSLINFGTDAKFAGETQNVSPVIRELLPLIAQENDFSAYDITYYPRGPRSWKDREKNRKKLKNPTSEQLGTATLENGAVAAVSLGIGKEGYVFDLNFGSDDDYIKFYHSKLFQKTKWHSGAE